MNDEQVAMLDRLAKEDGYTERAPYMRRLVNQEYARRFSQPQPLITVGEATSGNTQKEEK